MEKHNHKKKYPRLAPRNLYDLIYYETLSNRSLPITSDQVVRLSKGGGQ